MRIARLISLQFNYPMRGQYALFSGKGHVWFVPVWSGWLVFHQTACPIEVREC